MNLMTLQQFAKHKDGTYAAMDLTDESRELLDNFVEMNLGLTSRVDPSTYHITIIYSKTPVPTAETLAGMTTDTSASVSGYEVFPTKNDGKCLVMRLMFEFAENLNAKLTEMGATSDYAEYKPHMTLAYDMEQEVDVESLPIPQFPLYFQGLTVKPLEPDFVPANKN